MDKSLNNSHYIAPSPFRLFDYSAKVRSSFPFKLFVIGKDGTVDNGRVLNLLNGEKLNLNESLCQKYSDRAQTLLDTCKEVLDYNLIANYVTH